MSGTRPPAFFFRDAGQPLPSPDTHPCFRDDLARLRPRRTPFARNHVASRRLRLRGCVTSGRPTGSGGGGSGGEEGEVRKARRGRRGGAGRCGLRGTLAAPPRPALVSLGRLAGAGRDEAGVAAGCGRGGNLEEAFLPGRPLGNRRPRSRGSP